MPGTILDAGDITANNHKTIASMRFASKWRKQTIKKEMKKKMCSMSESQIPWMELGTEYCGHGRPY